MGGEGAGRRPPRVSVLVTCHRHAPFVDACLDGVAAQTFTDWELLVADDASGDGSLERIEAWVRRSGHPVAVVANAANRGVTRTLADLLGRATGTYVAHLGGDDRWHPMLLERLVTALDDAGPTTALAYADARLVDADGVVTAPSFLDHCAVSPAPEGDVFHQLLARNVIVASAVLHRRSALEAVGGWDPDLPYEDYDLLLRLADRFEVAVVDEPLVDHRIHDGSATRQRFSTLLEGRLRILERWLDRDPAAAAVILPQLRRQSWRLYKVHPELGRAHVAVAHRGRSGPVGRLRHLVATRPWAEATFEVLRRSTRPLRELSRRR